MEVNFICACLSSGQHSSASRCPPNEFQCGGTELCIHMSKLCNGAPDCTDGWDEGPHCRGIFIHVPLCKNGFIKCEACPTALCMHKVLSFWNILCKLRKQLFWNSKLGTNLWWVEQDHFRIVLTELSTGGKSESPSFNRLLNGLWKSSYKVEDFLPCVCQIFRLV